MPVPSVGVYGFLRRPKWIAFTLCVILLIVVMINLGFWQLRRLDERKDRNARVTAAAAAAVVPLDELVAHDTPIDATGDVQWRNVRVTGTYDASQQVLVRNRSHNGLPGYHVLTPLVLASGDAVLVNRGFIPIETEGDAPAVPAPPAGEVEVLGRVRSSQRRGSFGPRDPDEGRLTEVARADIARLQQQMPYPLLPVYLELETSTPADSPGVVPVPLPELDDGPHLSYALQWFTFSVLAVIGWVLVVRKTARPSDDTPSDETPSDEAPSIDQTAP